MSTNHALVIGAGGVIGRYVATYLADESGWRVTGVSRRKPEYPSKVEWLGVDMLDAEACRLQLKDLVTVTHLFYAGYQERPTIAALVAPNLAMLRNAVETVESASPVLRRVILYTGGKAYGSHLGPYKTPARESDPRHMPPNFYYDQEDYLARQQQGKPWTWTVLRPSNICGLATGNPMNISTVIAVYAAVSRELGLPLRFPGKEVTYEKLNQFTYSRHLARASLWAAENDSCAGEVFNIHNGDHVRWKYLWPKFAEFFGMPLGEPQRIPLVQFMADKEPLWHEMVRKHGLQPIPFSDLVSWPFGDFMFNTFEWDLMTSMTKIRRHGFHAVVDTEEMYLDLFRQFREARLIP